jgi:hypothetical protein
MKYIILSPKHSEGNTPTFWRPNCAGYTTNPWLAGIYEEKEIQEDPTYFNDGFGAVAIPLTKENLEELGFKCIYDPQSINKFLQKKQPATSN